MSITERSTATVPPVPAPSVPAESVPAASVHAPSVPARPRALRRVAVVVAGVLACAIPVVFTLNLTRMLVVGVDADHRFHQLTGQGVLMFVLGLAALLPLVKAGWTGRRPSAAVGLHHLAFVGVGLAFSAVAPGGGAPFLLGVLAVTGALLWLAVPARPSPRGLRVSLDPLLAPAAMVTAAVWAPYATGQLALQNAATGYHAQNPHLFDMAWLVGVLTLLAVMAALFPAARHLVRWTAAGSLLVGAAGFAFGEDPLWSGLALGVGALTGVVAVVQPVLTRRAEVAR